MATVNVPAVSVTLLLLSLGGLMLLHGLASSNGMMGLMLENIASLHPVIPGTDTPLRTRWLGVKLLDLDLSIMVTVFSSILDPVRNISLFLQGNHFFGLVTSSWVVVLLESLRKRTRTTLPRTGETLFDTVLLGNYAYVFWGLVMEFVGVAVGLPAWCAVNLWRSGWGTSQASFPLGESACHFEDVPILLLDVDAFLWSCLISVGIPSVLMVVGTPDPDVSAISSQQLWIVLRLLHPILFPMVYATLSRGQASLHNPTTSPSQQQNDEKHFKGIRLMYTVSWWMATLPHILTLGFVLLVAFIPRSITVLPIDNLHALSLASMWPAWAILRSISKPISTIQEGVSIFMTSNELISIIAFLLWAWTKNRLALETSHDLRLGHARFTFARLLLLSFTIGPAGAAISLLQDREEIFMKAYSIKKSKKAT